MPTFVHPALLWGLPLVGLPVLIHLINMMRHRRVRWAAMEFLLTSQKKNRAWVLLKQLLLLLLRMAAVAAVVMVVAQPLLRSRLGGFFGGTKTHHIVLLDDSFSMSDRRADSSAFDEAKAVIERIGAEAARRLQPQTFTLLRFSQVQRPSLGTQPDLFEDRVDTDFVARLRQTLDSLEPSHTAAGPLEALDVIRQLPGSEDGENRIVYLLTDFRARQWKSPGDLKNRLAQLTSTGATLQMINCVDTARPNLAIAGLTPAAGTRAAGVPLFMEVTVKNFGTSPVRDVPVMLTTDGHPLPAVTIEVIPPRQAVTERFTVRFPTAGSHQITATLEADAVAPDNVRYSVVDFPADLPVLLIDGAPDAADARYLSAALSPGGPVVTGITPRIEGPRYLSLNPLEGFRAIYLLNVERLERSAIRALEDYLAAGGGVGVFLGERARSKFINEQLYRQGEGFFPVPLAGQAELLVDRLQRAPDLQVTDHPVFRIFSGRANSFISTVIVRRYFSVPEGWQPDPESTTRVIARLRNSAPLAVERRFGDGRVVALLTTAAPVWNNWARNNPSFAVAMLELQAFLSADPAADVSQLVGAPLELELDPVRHEPPVRFSIAGLDDLPLATVTAVRTPDGPLVATLAETPTAGVYRAELIRKDATAEVRRRAFNVDPDEGDLEAIDGPQLADRLEQLEFDYHEARLFQHAAHEPAGYNLGQAILYALILLLIGEQILAWSASYHPPARRPVRAGGGAS